MPADAFFLLAGGCLLLAVLLPAALRSYAVSPPLVLAGGRCRARLDAARRRPAARPGGRPGAGRARHRAHRADRPDGRRPRARPAAATCSGRRSWRAWSPTWRLLGIAMPLCILGVALLGWALGLPLAAALVLGSVLAPTDPVLASDVQVGGRLVDPGRGGGGPAVRGGPDREQRVRRGAVRAHLRGRAERRPHLPLRPCRGAGGRRRLGARRGRRVARLVRRRQDRDRRRGRRAGRPAARPRRVPLVQGAACGWPSRASRCWRWPPC